MIRKLWMDEGGGLISAELVLVATLLICAVAVGVSAVRVALVTELADLGAAIGAIDQSYSVSGLLGHHASCAGQQFSDVTDTCDDGPAQNGRNSRCIEVCGQSTAPTGERGT